MKFFFLFFIISAIALGKNQNQLKFDLPARSNPTLSDSKPVGTVKIIYDKQRMSELGCDGRVVLSFMWVKVRFSDGDAKLISVDEAPVGDPGSMDTETLSFPVPKEAKSAAVWFEARNRFDSNDPPDCKDGEANNPYNAELE